ncbi:hypothetical protein [Streptomyces sp. Isolate_219]|uniref:hypothetical protein n=1 Tax=Streptomyces sp. Isolate_219 TaxID=2950110 RepID=UPI0021C57960|nr:hypothetical protein [Streptomyces sp. Isolate_219]MCR8576440.1 hypothetical protein [Streptomyces sp. Isolate_219]
MARAMGYDDTEMFRVIETFQRVRGGVPTGESGRFVHGPFSTLSAARGVRSREKRQPYNETSVFTIERMPVGTWTVVD